MSRDGRGESSAPRQLDACANGTCAVDVHTHFIPARYRQMVSDAGITHPDGFHGGMPPWSVESHLEHMELLGIARTVVSLSAPGVYLGEVGRDGVGVARSVNEDGARLCQEHAGRFGFYAAIPVLNVDAALAEIDYAFDELGAWGASLFTNCAGVYVSAPQILPVLEALAQREAPLLLHPTSPSVTVPGVMEGWSRSMYEYIFDTTRTVIDLICSAAWKRLAGLRLIVAHGGAALPALAMRVERNIQRVNAQKGDDERALPSLVQAMQESMYFDLAGAVVPYQLPSLKATVSTDRMLYGSDFPFTGSAPGKELNESLRRTDLLDGVEKHQIMHENAVGLFGKHLASEPMSS